MRDNPIATRLHKLHDLGVESAPAWPHHFVIAPDLLEAMTRTDVQRSIAAMIEAGMLRLPFPEILVEFSVEPGVTRFLWLQEITQGVEAKTAMLTSHGLATMPLTPATVAIKSSGLEVSGHADARDGQAIALGTAFALLMLNIKGVEKQHIAPSRLNRARAKVGAHLVPHHTVVRIGIVYDRAGKGAKRDGLKPVYLRAGHVRNQAFGKNWDEHRAIYIAPQLVNYQPGAEAPAPRMRVVAMGGR